MKKFLFFFLFGAFALHAHESGCKFKGKHSLACYHQCDNEALDDIESLRQTFFEAIQAAGAHTLSYTEHLYEDGAYALVVLLAESHATLHTYPECQLCFVDLFTLGDCQAQIFHHFLTEYLNPGLSNQNLIERG